MSRTRTWLTIGLALATAAACTDRPARVATAPATPEDGAPGAAPPAPPGADRRPERLAFLFAKALGNPEFRAFVKAQLDASPFPEQKLQFQRFLDASGRRALAEIARLNGITQGDVEREAAAAIPLEVYLPVPTHRAAWTGDENVLVATALQDRDVPLAFDPAGRRTLLSPDAPPATPVIAVVPVETDFIPRPGRVQCYEDCGGGGGGGGDEGGGGGFQVTPGLYMTRAHFDGTYESWLKGNPEFEIHILGQLGTTDSLTDYQCAGEHAGGPYVFDQNNKDWSGSVLLFSQVQINSYKATHPGQGMRVFALEDDDTACQIKTDPERANRLVFQVDSAARQLSGGRDTTTTAKYWRYARTAFKLFKALASLINTNDELIGNAVEDDIVGIFYAGFNWFIKGEGNITHGWVNLEMR